MGPLLNPTPTPAPLSLPSFFTRIHAAASRKAVGAGCSETAGVGEDVMGCSIPAGGRLGGDLASGKRDLEKCVLRAGYFRVGAASAAAFASSGLSQAMYKSTSRLRASALM